MVRSAPGLPSSVVGDTATECPTSIELLPNFPICPYCFHAIPTPKGTSILEAAPRGHGVLPQPLEIPLARQFPDQLSCSTLPFSSTSITASSCSPFGPYHVDCKLLRRRTADRCSLESHDWPFVAEKRSRIWGSWTRQSRVQPTRSDPVLDSPQQFERSPSSNRSIWTYHCQ
jgi:hypothetical protein